MSDPINLTNADFTFKDKNGNTGSNKGITDLDKTKLNNMVKLLNLLLNTPNSLDFVNTLANINLSNLSALGTDVINDMIDVKLLANYLPLAGGNVTGNLTVQNKNLVRSINGVMADAQGNAQLSNIGAITGKIEWFAFNTPPEGYLVCNGATVSRETYADLFAVIGTTFGSGDGSTTFNLPNLIDKFPQGSTTVGTVKGAGLPDHTHTYIDYYGALNDGHGGSYPLCATDYKYSYRTTEKASKSNSIYGNSTTVQPPALTLLPCIKY